MPQKLANPTFKTISDDRVADPARDRDSHSRGRTGLPQQQEELCLHLAPGVLLQLEELGALAQAFALGERLVDRLLLRDRDGQALAALRAPALQNLAALVRLHPLAKAMRPLATDVGRLVGPLAHERSPWVARRVWIAS